MKLPGFRDRSDVRRLAGIHAYVGANGSGKSLCMVHDTLATLASNRPVYSTVRLLGEDGEDHPNYVALRSFRQLMDVEGCDVLLDEVTGAVNARASMGLPVQFQNLLVQLRRRDVVLRWTSPNFARADTILRGVTQAVTSCRGSFAKASARTVGEEEVVRLWPERRLFRWRTFDAQDWEEVTAGKLEKARPLAKQWFWRPGSAVERAYDTLAEVSMLDHLDVSGICAVCGGKRRHPTCKPSCPGNVPEPTEARLPVRLGAPEARPVVGQWTGREPVRRATTI